MKISTLRGYKVFLTPILVVFGGCKTMDPGVTNVDKGRGEVAMYSAADSRTTLDLQRYKERPRAMAEALKKHLKENPNDLDATVSLAEVETALGDLDAAESNCRAVLRKDQKNKVARKTLAEIAMRRGNADMAALFLNDLGGSQSKDSGVLNMLAMIELQRGNNPAAMSLFKQALKVNTDDLAARMNLGVLLLKYRQLDQAAVEFERVLKSVPTHSDAKIHLAIIKSARGQRDEAESMYKQVLELDEQNPLALYNLAVLQKETGHYAEALTNLKTYLRGTRGKSNDTEQVLALIDGIQHQQASRGEKLSDDDIESMAVAARNIPATSQPTAKVANGDAVKIKAKEVTTDESQSDSKKEAPSASETEVSQDSQKNAPAAEDDLGTLEKSLQD
jgi:Tfp pilus assembly protein PilF